MKVAMVQMQVAAGDVLKNRERGLALARQAAARSDIVVLPEIWTTGYDLRRLDCLAEDEAGPTLLGLREIAAAYKAWVVAGSLPLRKIDGIYNETVVIDTNGAIAADYQKIHLFSMYGEEKLFRPGNKRTVFSMGDLKAGLAICYDLRFPELFRAMALDEAIVIFVVAEWPAARREHWRLLNQARAIENQVYICAVNCVGEHKGITFYGHSMLIGPDGTVLAEGTGEEGIWYGAIDSSLVAKTRQSFKVWGDRRPELY